MATFQSIAIRRANAIESLNATMKRIADYTALEVVIVPTQGRDQLVLQAQQLEVLNGFFEAVADLLVPRENLSYGDMSVPELEALAQARGIEPTEAHGVDGSWLKQDYVLSLESDDEAHQPEDYADWTRAQMMKEFEARSIAVESIKGTGSNGNVLVEDLRAALIAADEAQAAQELHGEFVRLE